MDAASAAVARKPVSIDGLLNLARPDMAGVDALIRDRMQSPVAVIPALAEHLVGEGFTVVDLLGGASHGRKRLG